MQWMRVGMGVAGGVLVIACSGSSPELIPNPANEPRPAASEASTPAASSSSSMPSEREAAKGGGEDAGIEASEPGPLVCGTNDAEPIDDCVPFGPCEQCAGGRVYVCEDRTGTKRPPIDGCASLPVHADGRTRWCCPSQCIWSPRRDEYCGRIGGGYALLCPTSREDDSHPTDRVPDDPSCRNVQGTVSSLGHFTQFCCDK